MSRIMNRQQMEETLDGGQVVSYNGRLITDKRDLPAEEEIAVTSADKRAALQRLLNEHRSLDERINSLKADIVETEKQETARGDAGRQADFVPQTHTMAGQPVNPITSGNVHTLAPVVRTDANVGPVNQGQGTGDPGTEGDEDDGEGDDKVIAGRKLSKYRDSLDKAKITKREDAIKHLDEKFEGVGVPTAEKIADALDLK